MFLSCIDFKYSLEILQEININCKYLVLFLSGGMEWKTQYKTKKQKYLSWSGQL